MPVPEACEEEHWGGVACVTNCFHCGDDDHLARECPRNRKPAVQVRSPGGVPAVWCSYCDEKTRMVDLGHSMQRCPNCHPLRYQQLKQSKKCPQCNKTVYDWDHAPCDAHLGPGLPVPAPARKGRPDELRFEPRRLCYRSPLGQMVHAPGCQCPAGVP